MADETPPAPAPVAPVAEAKPAAPAAPAEAEAEGLLPGGEVDRATIIAKLKANRLAAEAVEVKESPKPATPHAPAEAAESISGAPVEPEKPKELASERFALLAREQKKLRQEREELKQQRAEVDTYRRAKADAAKNPTAALKELGLSYEQLTESLLSGGRVDPVATVAEQVKALQAELASERAARAEQAEATALEQFRASISKAAVAAGEKYELVQARKAEDIALQVIKQHYAETGELLGGSPEKAIDIALEHVEALLERDADSWLSTNKVKRKLQPAGHELAAPTGPRAGRAPTVPTRTLTNSQASLVPTPAEEPESTDPKVLRERLKRDWRARHGSD